MAVEKISGVEVDIYGFGGSLRGIFGGVLVGARRSGRTSRMLDLIRTGDVVICLEEKEVTATQRALKKRGIPDVRVLTIKQFNERRGGASSPTNGRVHFTHEFVEQHYQTALDRADDSLHAIELILCRKPAVPPTPPPRRDVSFY